MSIRPLTTALLRAAAPSLSQNGARAVVVSGQSGSISCSGRPQPRIARFSTSHTWLSKDTSNAASSSSTLPSTPEPSPATAAPAATNPLSEMTSPSSPSDPKPLPILPRPLGQRDPPTTAEKTWQETKEELMDQGKRMEKRRALVKEATQGYFHDFHQIRREGGHGGKTWIGPPVLIREDRARYFPNISGPTLTSSSTTHTTDLFRGKISVVVVLSARISEEHAMSFVGDVLEDWESAKGASKGETAAVAAAAPGEAGIRVGAGSGEREKLFQYVQINHQPNPLKSLLLRLFMSSLKRTMKPERWPGYMIAGGEWGGLKEPLGITNKHVGYIYLVDQHAKIRWAGCGFATPEEREALRRGVAVLLGRAKEGR